MTLSRRSKSTTHSGLRRDLLDATGVLLTQARSALFITGPALTADSGLPHFRGFPAFSAEARGCEAIRGRARNRDAAAQAGTTWKYLLEMDAMVRAAQPNRGHEVLVLLERVLKRSTIMTVNVDRLHQRAGSRNVIEMHGALHDLLCTRCEISTRHERFDQIDIPPLCKTCGGVLRPDMPLFGESLPADPFTRLQAELDEGFDIVFAIGVGTMFPYIARPLLVAKSEGIPTVEIGQQHTDLSDVVDFRFRGSPMRVLDLIWEVCQQVGRPSQDKL